jgi:hypothetical protein
VYILILLNAAIVILINMLMDILKEINTGINTVKATIMITIKISQKKITMMSIKVTNIYILVIKK